MRSKPRTRFGTACYVVFGTIGFTAFLVIVNVLLVALAG